MSNDSTLTSRNCLSIIIKSTSQQLPPKTLLIRVHAVWIIISWSLCTSKIIVTRSHTFLINRSHLGENGKVPMNGVTQAQQYQLEICIMKFSCFRLIQVSASNDRNIFAHQFHQKPMKWTQNILRHSDVINFTNHSTNDQLCNRHWN